VKLFTLSINNFVLVTFPSAVTPTNSPSGYNSRFDEELIIKTGKIGLIRIIKALIERTNLDFI
jgi:hypothetical protein